MVPAAGWRLSRADERVGHVAVISEMQRVPGDACVLRAEELGITPRHLTASFCSAGILSRAGGWYR